MFAEDEWEDETETRTTISCPKPVGSNAKSKVVGKKSLQRTLQSLGSVPDWSKDIVARDGSDSETEGVSVPPPHTKKKRIKKRKRGAAKRAEEAAKESGEPSKEEPAAVAGVKKLKEKPGPPRAKNTESIKADGKEDAKAVSVGGKPALNAKTLTRKQWKNKMKSKKKCANKYRPNGERKQVVKPATTAQQSPAEGQQVNPDGNCETSVTKPQPLTQKNKQEKEVSGKARKRKMAQEGEEIAPTVDTPTVDTLTPKDGETLTKAGKKTKGGPKASRASLEPSGQEPHQEVNQAQQDDGEEQPHSKRRKPEESKKKQQRHKIEKLRRALQGQGSDETPASAEPSPPSEEEATRAQEEAELPADRSSALRSRMEQRLESARFRFINELLYTTSSGEAKRMFRQDPQAFGIYHRGFTAQVQRWPANPVDAIISYIRHKPASLVVADFGCGDCKIALSVKNKVHSFDLAPICDLVTVCDMANVPLDDASVNIAVFCLSLMGTNLGDFLVEANRVLVMGGVLKIAEVASRFENVRSFMNALASLGFKLATKDTENSHFYSFEFVKTGDAPKDIKKSGLELRPCVYKKR